MPAKAVQNLTDRAIKQIAVDPHRRISRADGGGLFLEVYPGGTRSWRYSYRLRGATKSEKVSLGTYPKISLKEARKRAAESRALVKAGISPARVKASAKRGTQRPDPDKTKTAPISLEHTGDAYLTQLESEGKKSVAALRRYLIKDIYPALGATRALESITADDLAAVITLKANRPGAANAVRGVLKRVFSLALKQGRIATMPVFPDPMKMKSRDRVLSANELRTFCVALNQPADGDRAKRLSLALILITLVRKTELAAATWDEISFSERTWRIPASRTKSGKPHDVYLSAPALAAFRELQTLAAGSPYVLPDTTGDKPAAHNALNRTLHRLQRPGMMPFTVHDLRRTGATLLHEQGFSSDVIEKALNHSIPGVRGVYNRAAYADQRRQMLESWGDFLEKQRGGNVVFGRFSA